MSGYQPFVENNNYFNRQFGNNNVLPSYRFYCQLAHGSPTRIIGDFTTVRQMYAKIAECFDIDFFQIMYCTLNTHYIDMTKLLAHKISLNDFLFVHVKGQPKEIIICKTSNSFGLTLADNGCGVVIIKRFNDCGFMNDFSKSCGDFIQVGDQIERINNISFVGRKNFEVANYLQNIPVGETFTLRLISPKTSPIYALSACRNKSHRCLNKFGSGYETIRINPSGETDQSEILDTEIEKTKIIDCILGKYLGFENYELAYSIYTLAKNCHSPTDLEKTLPDQTLELNLSKKLIYEIWQAANTSDDLSTTPNINKYNLGINSLL